MGFTSGDENEYADQYEGIKGVGTIYKTALFAGGCFWCMEAPFDRMDGVLATVSGYSGGAVERPSYREVSSGFTVSNTRREFTWCGERLARTIRGREVKPIS